MKINSFNSSSYTTDNESDKSGQGKQLWRRDYTLKSQDSDNDGDIGDVQEFARKVLETRLEGDEGHPSSHSTPPISDLGSLSPNELTDERDTNYSYIGPFGKKQKVVRDIVACGENVSSSSEDAGVTLQTLSPQSADKRITPSPSSSRRESSSPPLKGRSRLVSGFSDQPLNLCFSHQERRPSCPGPSYETERIQSDQYGQEMRQQRPSIIQFKRKSRPTSTGTSPSHTSGGSSPSSTTSTQFPRARQTVRFQETRSRETLRDLGGSVTLDRDGSRKLKKKYICLDCKKEFSQLRNYRYHRSRHEGTSQFACTCPICGKSFNDKGYLSSHLKIHRNAKEYKCDFCDKSFNQRVAYNMHIRIHTGHKPHQCHLCIKAFSRKMLLRQHLRTHTGERPYKCEVCDKAFADRSNMLLHQRLHSGQRPYKCEVCGKTFSKNHHLKTHLNHHAGIRPYQCEKCKACFSQSSNMKTHFKKCTGTPVVTETNPQGGEEGQGQSSQKVCSSGYQPISFVPFPQIGYEGQVEMFHPAAGHDLGLPMPINVRHDRVPPILFPGIHQKDFSNSSTLTKTISLDNVNKTCPVVQSIQSHTTGQLKISRVANPIQLSTLTKSRRVINAAVPARPSSTVTSGGTLDLSRHHQFVQPMGSEKEFVYGHYPHVRTNGGGPLSSIIQICQTPQQFHPYQLPPLHHQEKQKHGSSSRHLSPSRQVSSRPSITRSIQLSPSSQQQQSQGYSPPQIPIPSHYYSQYAAQQQRIESTTTSPYQQQSMRQQSSQMLHMSPQSRVTVNSEISANLLYHQMQQQQLHQLQQHHLQLQQQQQPVQQPQPYQQQSPYGYSSTSHSLPHQFSSGNFLYQQQLLEHHQLQLLEDQQRLVQSQQQQQRRHHGGQLSHPK